MAEAAQSRVQAAIKDFINQVDKSKLRGMKREVHLCSAACCEDGVSSIKTVHRCVEQCQVPTQRAQQFVQSELEQFQESLSRCVLQCQDEIKDKVGPNTPQNEILYNYKINKYLGEFETCAIACCDKNIAKLPNLLLKLKATFEH